MKVKKTRPNDSFADEHTRQGSAIRMKQTNPGTTMLLYRIVFLKSLTSRHREWVFANKKM